MSSESSQMAFTRAQSMHSNISGKKDHENKNVISFIHASPTSSPARVTEMTNVSPTPPPSSKSNNKDQFIQTSSSQRNAGRLPPTVDPSLIHQCQSTRLAFSKALANDQIAASEPDYRTSFKSANDVVKRLLPYHVWHVRDEDILHVLNDRQSKKRLKEDRVDVEDNSMGKADEAQKVLSASVSLVKRRKRPRGKGASPIQQIAKQYPTIAEADHSWQKYLDIHSRAKGLQSTLIGAQSVQAPAPFAQESRYHLEKMAWEEEREALVENQRILRVVREDAMAKGVPWSAILPILTGELQKGSGDESDSEERSEDEEDDVDSSDVGSEDGHQSATIRKGENKTAQHKFMREVTKPRGRPRKERDEYGKIIRPSTSTTMPTIHSSADQQSTQSTNAGPSLPSPASNMKGGTATKEEQKQQGGESSTASSSYVIPSQPIRLVLPFSTLTQLSALGINPIPASHLLPAIAARQAAASSPATFSMDQFDTAPRPSPVDQQEPALLMGFTSTSAMKENQSQEDSLKKQQSASSQNDAEMIHISLVLSKLGPSQLSGLATLMQRMQSNGK
ncbi:uncharacterized protein FA14DRAFT_159529 [Meira miltonrushii]|uniref:GLTSCR protein conserved domain-containing protein n=1 Tax=Meira miltonrushii TaxID=1280837 RepID=A0A316VPV5_9BASI|nr:uncharacterized protein FA14DRAFT_159529 [Meira miltonrushii]PWN37505.1 hypothetical protein FA14DRAFT_159529 [Meira miltonrushii]